MPGNILPKEQVSPDMPNFFNLRDASFLSGEHGEFKEYLKSYRMSPKWVIESWHHAVELLTNQDRRLSDIKPTMRILLKYGVKITLTWKTFPSIKHDRMELFDNKN